VTRGSSTRGSSRRDVLRAGTCGVALALLSPQLASATTLANTLPGPASADLAQRLARLIATPEHASALGAALGPVREPDVIVAGLCDAWGISPAVLESASDRDLIDAVTRHHARDVESGDFVMRNGWILSRTEASLYEVAAAFAPSC
jgi:hypothetical protein